MILKCEIDRAFAPSNKVVGSDRITPDMVKILEEEEFQLIIKSGNCMYNSGKIQV